jgi:hypothetical protein
MVEFRKPINSLLKIYAQDNVEHTNVKENVGT